MHVERVATEARALREEHAARLRRLDSTSAAIVNERLRMFGATDSGTSAPPG